MKRVYMYGFHERMWHWMQAAVIIGLIYTGLEIHFPDIVSVLGFSFSLTVHTILGFLLLINAVLGLLYHIFTKEIRQFFPAPSDFLTQAFRQADYYLRGIFKNVPHPFEKTPGKKLNPLQKITYLAILNVLLPLQVFSGFLLWISEHSAHVTEWFGGVGAIAPFHTLLAWLFAAFILMHMYLATTGRSPMSNLKAMIVGWEDIEGNDENKETGA